MPLDDGGGFTGPNPLPAGTADKIRRGAAPGWHRDERLHVGICTRCYMRMNLSGEDGGCGDTERGFAGFTSISWSRCILAHAETAHPEHRCLDNGQSVCTRVCIILFIHWRREGMQVARNAVPENPGTCDDLNCELIQICLTLVNFPAPLGLAITGNNWLSMPRVKVYGSNHDMRMRFMVTRISHITNPNLLAMLNYYLDTLFVDCHTSTTAVTHKPSNMVASRIAAVAALVMLCFAGTERTWNAMHASLTRPDAALSPISYRKFHNPAASHGSWATQTVDLLYSAHLSSDACAYLTRGHLRGWGHGRSPRSPRVVVYGRHIAGSAAHSAAAKSAGTHVRGPSHVVDMLSPSLQAPTPCRSRPLAMAATSRCRSTPPPTSPCTWSSTQETQTCVIPDSDRTQKRSDIRLHNAQHNIMITHAIDHPPLRTSVT